MFTGPSAAEGAYKTMVFGKYMYIWISEVYTEPIPVLFIMGPLHPHTL